MKKKLLLVLLALSFYLLGKAQTVVNNLEAGSLKTSLPAPLTGVTDLTVTGTIDARDFRTIREDLPNLVKLNLSGTAIVTYTGSEGTALHPINGGDMSATYAANGVPANAFYVPRQTNFLGVETKPEKRLKLQELQLPAGITAIDNSALAKLLDLTSTVLDLSHHTQLETIGNTVFEKDSTLTEIKLPPSIKTIGSGAFRDCAALTSFTVPAATTTLGSAMLSGCSNISSITFEAPASVTVLSSGFFVGMPKLMEVEIPASVTNLTGAFAYGNTNFKGTKITVDPANPNYASNDGILYDKAQTKLIVCPAGKTSATILPTTETIDGDAFRYGLLTSITIPQSVKSMGTYVFAETKLEQVSFEAPASLESLPNYAFWRDTFLVAINLPANLKTIGNEVFNSTAALQSITLPASITSIGNNVFAYSGVESADFSAITGLTAWGTSTFRLCEKLTSVQLPPAWTTIPNSTFETCKALKSFTVPAGVLSIGNYAFSSSGLENINLPEGLTTIGSDAFSSTPLKSITLPKTVTTLTMGSQGSPFNRSSARITVDPDNPNYSSLNGVLYNKDQTKLIVAPVFLSGSFVLPNTVTGIEGYAFFNDTLLTSVEFPESLTTIGNNIVNDCLRLTKLIVNNPVPVTITASTFYDADPVTYENRILTNATLFVPKGTLADYQAAANWKNFAHIQEMSFFYDLGYGTSEYPGGISPNGKYLVGSPGFLWENKGNGDNTTVHIDGTDDLRSINDDGVMTGNFYDPKFKVGEASIRNGGVYKEGVWYSLGLGRYQNVNPDSGPIQVNSVEIGTVASAITKDGWVFGMSCEKNNVARVVPMRWKPDATGQYTDTLVYSFPEDNLPIAERTQGARFLDVSSDGSVACGWAVYKETHGSRRPVVWTSPTEYDILNKDVDGEAPGISPNGKYVAVSTGNKAAIYDVQSKKLTVFGVEGTRAVAVSDDGTVVGFRNTISEGRKGFVWSDKLGYIELKEFIERYASNITLPDGSKFDEPESQFIMDVPMAISGDGLVFAGWRGAVTMRKVWVVALPAPLDLVSRPQDLAVQVNPVTRNEVTLSWTEPTDKGSHLLDYYYIYRNDELIGQVDVNDSEQPASFTDTDAPAGYPVYRVSAVYDYDTAKQSGRESGKSDPATATVVDTYDLPFYDGFDGGYRANFWEQANGINNMWALVSSGYNNPTQQARSAIFVAVGDQTAYSHTLTSKPLDGNGKDKISLSFMNQISFEQTPAGVRDTIHLEISTDATGTVWNTIYSYVVRNNQNWTAQSHDITGLAKDKLFKIRFRAVSGSNRNATAFWIDELAVATNTVSAAQNVKANKTASGGVEVIWQEPSGSYGLTYAKASHVGTIGNAGVPFIGANRFRADSLSSYKDLKLTSITAYINGKGANATVDTKLRLAVFVDGVRVNSQDIESFEGNAWNTFPLNNPVALSGVSSELAFGIEVVEHDTESYPLSTDWLKTTEEGWSDAYTEDNGATWETLTSWELSFNWSIIGNFRKEAAATERTNGILGYEVYRNGEKIESPFGLTFGQRFIDNTTEKEPCYTVKAYYTLGGFAEASEEGCMALSGDNTLASLTVSEGKLYPAFNPNVTEYAVEVFPPVETIVVTGTANDVAATVEGNGTHSLVTGNNAIHIIVTAENGSTQTYTVNVERGNVGIDNVNTPAISIYPNPTTGRVYIRSSANKAPEIIVSNLLGEQLLRTTGNSVDLSGYAKGAYLLQVNGEVVKIMKK